MKKYIFPLLLLVCVLFSCNDFLDREPLDSVSTNKYLLNESDLAAYSAKLYEEFPSHKDYGMGIFKNDNNSDNQAGSNPNEKFVKRQTRVEQSIKEDDDPWNFKYIRSVNYFINTVRPRLEQGELGGVEANNTHYLGEMYFFRAWFYFQKLVELGDFPILKEWITEDYETVREASKRRPRNEVARFILQDLDSAYFLMQSTPPMSNRLTRNCAALMKSRVALYEGTWEKYHSNTARVPGGPGWPGASKDYLKDFTIDIDSETRFFFTEAMESAAIVADAHPLYTDYESLFNSKSLSGMSEVLLWRQYDASLTPSVNHFVVGYIQREGGGNTGYTRSMVESFLMQNGLPIYATGSGYQGDATYEALASGRDPRLTYNMLLPGNLLSEKASFNEYIIDGRGYYHRAMITHAQAENRCPTGYSVKKGLTPDPEQGPTLPSETACIIFRSAEAYLNYIEADYELNGSLDGKSIQYWQAIRSRAGMDTDINKTIQATDPEHESDLARYSGNALVSSTLYNIRRERRIELAAEGFRFRDLKRWRSLDMMQDYHVQGINLWDEIYKRYMEPLAGLDTIRLYSHGVESANVSSPADGKYMYPYRVNSNNIAFDGYNWNEHKYLEPIAFDHFRLTTATEGSPDYESSTIYQNPGWKIEVGSLPEGE